MAKISHFEGFGHVQPVTGWFWAGFDRFCQKSVKNRQKRPKSVKTAKSPVLALGFSGRRPEMSLFRPFSDPTNARFRGPIFSPGQITTNTGDPGKEDVRTLKMGSQMGQKWGQNGVKTGSKSDNF